MERRSWLEQGFADLYVGRFDGIDAMADDQLEDLVDELEYLQQEGMLDLETEQGMTNLMETVESYL